MGDEQRFRQAEEDLQEKLARRREARVEAARERQVSIHDSVPAVIGAAEQRAEEIAGTGDWEPPEGNCPRLVCQQETGRLGLALSQQAEHWDALGDLIGTWKGRRGWNVIATPDPDTPDKDRHPFCLLVRPYYETITVTPVIGLVPNRGARFIQCIAAVRYDLSVNDLCDDSGMHVENGMFLLLHNRRDHRDSVARLANVPHGNATLSIGDYLTNDGPPDIPDISSLPIAGAAPLGYTDPYLQPFPDCEGRPVFKAVNPNATLRMSTPSDVVHTTTLTFSSEPYGGIVNIPFLERYADTTLFDSAFWIETTESGTQVLQYSQTIWIEFLPNFTDPSKRIIWPHVDINTLVKTS